MRQTTRGDIAAIEPGHDAWIVGDEAFTSVDFGGRLSVRAR